MAKTGIVQLYGESGSDLALFSFDLEIMSEAGAASTVEQALEDAYQKDEAGEIEDNDVLSEAVEQLEKQGIKRIYAAIANTDRL